MRQHLEACADCRAYYQRHLVLAEMDRESALAPAVRLAIGLGLERPRHSARAPLFVGLAVATAAALVALAVPSLLAHRTEFASRGAIARSADAESFVYRPAPGGSPEPIGGSAGARRRAEVAHMGRSDELAFTYTNRGGWPYLLVFGVDEHRHVYWYHPAWQSADETPRAVAIRPGSDARELPDATSHALDGARLRIVGLFSRSALSTRDVEARLKTADPERLGAAFPDGLVSELDLGVGER
jgi:hypothetical protein